MPKFTGEAARHFEPVPEGDYDLVITKIDEQIVREGSKHAGAEMWRISYDIGDGGQKVFSSLVFVQKSFWRISNWWRALGHEVVPDQEIDLPDPAKLIGAQLKAHLIVTEFNGIEQNEIAYFIEPKEGEITKEPRDIPF